MRRLLTIAAAFTLPLAAAASPAAADVAAVWDIQGKGDLRLYVRDADTFLADPEGPGALLMRDGTLWVLTDDDGLRASRTWDEVERPEAAVGGLRDVRDTLRLVSVERTGARETLEGVAGDLWTATENGSGDKIQREVALSPDERLVLATEALARLGEAISPYRLAEGVPLEQAAAEAAERGFGLLRYGEIVRLRHLNTAAFSEHAYDTEPQAAQRPYETYDFNGDPSPLPKDEARPAVN